VRGGRDGGVGNVRGEGEGGGGEGVHLPRDPREVGIEEALQGHDHLDGEVSHEEGGGPHVPRGPAGIRRRRCPVRGNRHASPASVARPEASNLPYPPRRAPPVRGTTNPPT